MAVKRSKDSILYDILHIIRSLDPIRPTHLLYKANLSHQMMNEYLDEMIAADLVRVNNAFVVNKYTHKTYSVTIKGIDCLQKLASIKKIKDSITDEFGISFR